MGFYTAFTSVMLPRMSAILKKNDEESFKRLIKISFELLLTVSLPLVVCLMIMAPETIIVLAGEEYIPAALLSRIILPMLFVVGIAQILVFQIIIPKGFDGVTLRASMIGAVIGILLNVVLTTQYYSIGTCITLVLTELCVTGFYIRFVIKNNLIIFDFKLLRKHIGWSLPYIIFCLASKIIAGENSLVALSTAFGICLIYFIISQKYLIKNSLFLRNK